MRIDVNLDEVQEGFDVLPPGRYEVEVVKATRHQGPKGQYIRWQLHPLGGAGLKGLDKPGDLFYQTTLVPEGLTFLKRFLQACSLEWAKDGFDTDDVLQAGLEVEVSQAEFEGRLRNSVDECFPL